MEGSVSSTPSLHVFDWAIMALYFALVLGVGVLFSRKEKDTDEYLLGGRRMPWFIIGISYMVSLMSTISLVSIPGEAFKYGITKSIHTITAPIAAIGTFYLFVRFYFRAKVFTPFSYLEERFDRRVRLVGSLIFWWTRVAYLAMVLYSSSKVFEGAADWPVWATVCLVGFVGIVYTTMGGMKAVVWTDVSQFVILVVGMAVVTAKCAGAVKGGFAGVIEYSFAHGRGFDGIREPGFFSLNPYVRLSFWLLLISIVAEMMFYNSSDQISIQRLLSTSSYQQAKKSVYTFAAIGLPFAAMLWFLGLTIFSYYGQHPAEAADITGDTALFRYVSIHLPTPIPGLMISAMLAAVMSTLDSGLNSLATVATKDVYIEYFRPNATELEQVRFSRIMTVVVGVFAIVVALIIASVATSIEETIMEASTIWIAFGGVLAPIFLLGVTTRRVNGNHILFACIVAWAITAGTVTWYLISKAGDRPLSFLFVGVPGPVMLLVIGYVCTLLPGKRDPQKSAGLTLWTLRKDATPPTPDA
ncbi:MAG: sodium/solute symporter [Candidatus Hydrogenedentes bacterium]|nr:sodium/solute symporter [Candidatus Hydrogenedentota bacterium]